MIRIRPLASGDLNPVLSITVASPEASQWTRADYEQFLRNAPSCICSVAEIDNAVAGFICFRVVSDEAEVLNLVVSPSARRRGVASRLLADATRISEQRGARRMFLEVRDTNQPAILFYERHGFRLTARRRRYYSNPLADALILARDLVSA